MEKQFSRTSVQFKGEGWYATDYARKGGVAEKVEKELSTPEPAAGEKPKDKTKKPAAKKTSSEKG